MNFGAVLLAGGRSRRMGTSKAFLKLDGEPLYRRVISILGIAGAQQIVVVAPASTDLPESPLEIVRCEDPDGELGPLGALSVGLETLAQTQLQTVVLACVDAVGLTAEYLRTRLTELAATDVEALLATNDQGLVEVFASVAQLHPLRIATQSALAQGKRSLNAPFLMLRHRKVTVDRSIIAACNTPADRALHRLV